MISIILVCYHYCNLLLKACDQRTVYGQNVRFDMDLQDKTRRVHVSQNCSSSNAMIVPLPARMDEKCPLLRGR